jgi:hypothetical protein
MNRPQEENPKFQVLKQAHPNMIAGGGGVIQYPLFYMVWWFTEKKAY